MEELNMDFASGMELVVRGVANEDAARFSVNFGDSKKNIALHLDQRFNYLSDVETIVMNSSVDGEWQNEIRSKSFPFSRGGPFEVAIHFNADTFDIYLSNGDKLQFPNRFQKMIYSHLFFADGAKIKEITLKPSARPSKK